ncbi:helix-turn-helix domain-containing protein [Variovorax sp. tm]|uniref:helix-turn-helix domain-containing protein n=1 Tax=Variovorax atrisoli TaxID=3394203 RepID=UPI003A80C3C6
MVTPQGKSLGESASDLSGRSSDQDFHDLQRSGAPATRIGRNGHEGAKSHEFAKRLNNGAMRAHHIHQGHLAQGTSTASSLAALALHVIDRDTRGTLVPRLETQIVVRFGSMARDGLDAHVLGARQQVHRKLVRGGQRIVVARLRLGVHEAVLGAPASAIAGHTVALEDLWDDSAQLFDRLAGARSMAEAAAALEGAISERLDTAQGGGVQPRFALEAARMLESASVDVVAADLGVSARHLRRVFREALGISPKAFARLTRFHRALRDARHDSRMGWAGIAAAAGYYDQAHLIAEFRAIAGVTPRALVDELRTGPGID